MSWPLVRAIKYPIICKGKIDQTIIAKAKSIRQIFKDQNKSDNVCKAIQAGL